jgi:HAD superfamily hydrolase (TIGR01509 family)
MPLRALIFDVDGTLAETEELHRLAFNQAFAEAGLGWVWDETTYRQLLKVTGGKERMLAYAAAHDPARLDQLGAQIIRLHSRKTSIYAAMVTKGELKLRPGIHNLIRAARDDGLTMAIATTTSPDNVSALLTAELGVNWATLFPVVAAGDLVTHKKPASDIYDLALARLGCRPGDALAIEDSANGVQSARGAGLKVVALRSRYLIDDDLSAADLVIESPDVLTLAHIRSLPV